jgi:serine/threonine-protein kinase
MPFETVDSLVQAVLRSGLLDPEQRDELVGKLQGHFSEPWALAEFLVRWGWLTVYQIHQLSQGGDPVLVLGPYRILDRLGEGGVSRVFKAWHREGQFPVALKVIHPEMLHNDEAVGRFQREMQAMARLRHPNVVRAFDVNLSGTTQYFAMEYIEGIDLAKLVQLNGPLPVPEACEYVRQAALGLQHIHECGLVHRDIKPANLLVTLNEGTLKILDLGLARLRPPSGQDPGRSLTRDGIMIGTPDYLAPEQARDPRSVDIRADIYSLGCTLYFLLTGQPPFPGGSLLEKLVKHQNKAPARSDLLRPGVKEKLHALQQKMMAKLPEDRFQTPAEVALALAPFARPQDLGAGTVS